MSESPLRYNDWEISERHTKIIEGMLPKGYRSVQLQRQITGVVNGRITERLRAGVYLMPLGGKTVSRNNCTKDIRRRSLLVAAEGLSTANDKTTPRNLLLAESIRDAFANRRVAMLNGELYSFLEDEADYEIDDAIARKYDVLILVLASVFREDR
jgi:hypothetical protein